MCPEEGSGKEKKNENSPKRAYTAKEVEAARPLSSKLTENPTITLRLIGGVKATVKNTRIYHEEDSHYPFLYGDGWM